MGRAPCCEKMGLKKGPWTSEEDHILVSFINKFGHGNWRALPKEAGLLRCGKSCRLRWMNYLRPDIKRGNFTPEEEQTIINLHQIMGNRWSTIAEKLPGRTDNEIKNVWHTHLKKRLSPDYKKRNTINMNKRKLQTIIIPQHQESRPCDSLSSSEFSSSSELKPEHIEDYSLIDDSFWSDTLSTDQDSKCPSEFHDNQFQSDASADQTVQNESGFVQNLDDGMEFWYDIFISSGGVQELPEF